MTTPDARDRDRIRTELGTSFIVEASAGTGKTTEIINRIVAVLAAGTRVGSVVIVTFTNKAAGELKLRLRAALERARQVSIRQDERRSLEDALAHLEEARVSTIHSFCNDLLKERPVEARIDPSFETLPEPEARRLYARAFQNWLETALATPTPNLQRILRRTPYGGSITQSLRHSGWVLATWRDYSTPWEPQTFDRAAAVERVLRQLERLAAMLRTNPTDPLAYSLRSIIALSDHIARTESVRPRDLDELEAQIVELASDRWLRHPRRGTGTHFTTTLTRAEVLQAFENLCRELDAFRAAADADLAPRIQELLIESLRSYEALKAERGVLDFDDLLIRTRDLVRDNVSVRAELQQRFTHIFVDEFQDTSALQAEFLLLLCADDPSESDAARVRPAAGKLFIVGDPKQSIYRFRHADIRVYEAIKARLVVQGVECLRLSTSFRAVPTLQRLVNRAFEPVMTDPVHQPDYVPLEPWRSEADSPSVIVLAAPRPYGGNDQIAKKAIRESLPDATAALIDWLVHGSGWTVEEDGQHVPIEPHHICLLFRQYADFGADLTRPYVTALEARDLPHIVVGGRSLHGREEVETLRAAVAAIEYPDDDLSVYATLRGGLFAFPDADLFAYQQLHPLDYTRVPETVDPAFADIRDALLFLRSLHRRRNVYPVADTIMRLIEHTRSFANFVFRPSGEQVLANVLLVEEYAHAYDMSASVSFRGFVQQLERDAERSQAKEAPTLEEGTAGVRMMTVHKAKGLEFPVVILADFCASRGEQPREYFDSDRHLAALTLAGCSPRELLDNVAQAEAEDVAEMARLAYVAATRARDLLVISALGEEPFEEGWLAPLAPAIYPQAEDRRIVPPPLYCTEFGTETTLVRPPDSTARSVRPGTYAFGDADAPYTVVWWDPAALTLNAPPKFGIRQDTLLTHVAPAERIEEELSAYAAWQTRRSETLATAGTPTITIRRTTEVARHSTDDAPSVIIVDVPRPEIPRPTGPRFGTLVHAVLAAVPLDADADTVTTYTSLCAIVLGLPPEDAAAAADACVHALAHPLMRRAAAADRLNQCRREVPLTLMNGDELIEGIADIAFFEEGDWHVVDFKTDTDLENERSTYERQITLYARAIAAATGVSCDATILRI